MLSYKCKTLVSEKTIVGNDCYEQLIAEEIEGVKKLKDGGKGGWVINNRQNGQFWEDEGVKKVKNIGLKSKKDLAKAGILTVFDLLSAQFSFERVSEETGISIAVLAGLHQNDVEGVTPGNRPASLVKDYRKATNPYEARYGEQWKEEIAKVSGMKNGSTSGPSSCTCTPSARTSSKDPSAATTGSSTMTPSLSCSTRR